MSPSEQTLRGELMAARMGLEVAEDVWMYEEEDGEERAKLYQDVLAAEAEVERLVLLLGGEREWHDDEPPYESDMIPW